MPEDGQARVGEGRCVLATRLDATRLMSVYVALLTVVRLTNEILLLIYDSLNTADLKPLRLKSRTIEPPATLCLFRTLVLYPHRQSFESFLRAAETPHFAIHVQCLHYDAGFAFVPAAAYQRLKQLCEERNMEPTEEKAVLSIALRAEFGTLRGSDLIGNLTQLALLTQGFVCWKISSTLKCLNHWERRNTRR